MTLPNGLDGISAAIGTLFGSGGPLTPVPGAETWGSLGISQMNTLTQEVVTGLLGENVVKNSPNWNAMSSSIYAGLTPGISWPLAIIEQTVSALTGLPLGSWDTVNDAMLALQSYLNAITENNQTALQGVLTAITDYTDAATFWATINSIYTTWVTTASGLTSSEVASISQMIEKMFGINSSSGWLISTGNITSGTGLANLTDDWNKVVSFWDNLLGIGNDPTTTQVQAASVASVGGTSDMGSDIMVTQDAAAGLAATVAQVQSDVNNLQNASDATIGGVQITDDGPGTNATGDGWGSDWTLNSGSNANLDRGFQCLGGDAIGSYTGESLNTDNMVAGIIFDSTPNYDWFGDSADGARHRVKIRESSDRSSCVFADIWHDKVQIGYRKANVDTYIGSATATAPVAGSNWELYGGDVAGATPYLFNLVQNGVTASPIATWSDTGHLSNLGSSYRGSGQDMYSDGTYYPGKTKFHARDLIQPLLKTMMAQHRNTSTSVSSLAAGGIYTLPVGWFNSQTYLMPGVTMDTAKAGYIVADEGLYEFSFGIEVTSGITGTPYIIAPVIWVNSAPYVEGQSVYAHDNLVSGYSAQITMSIYLFAGDLIRPALDTRANQWSIAGESSGTLSWMQLAKVG